MSASEPDSQVCSPRHSFAFDNLLRRLIQSPVNIAGPYLNKGDTVIDLGCGPGFFTLPLADLVGPSGTVIAVDLQQEMLDRLKTKLESFKDRSKLAEVKLHRCSEHQIDLAESIKADFVLAFYMVHETPNQRFFLEQVRNLLKPTGTCLVVEPPFHVSKKAFTRTLEFAEQAGLTILDRPKRKGGKSALLGIRS